MKTTIDISDALGEAAKRAAERDGTTLRALVEEGLRLVLHDRDRKRRFTLREASYKGRGLNPALADAGWERIRELVYEGRS